MGGPPRAPQPEPHPLAQVYCIALRTYIEASEKLEDARHRLAQVERELNALEESLAGEYGLGYLTVKTVRNRAGKRYRYPVWRRLEGGEVYLTRDPRARELLALREQARRLRRQITRAKHAARTAWVLMQTTREYRSTCAGEGGA